MTAPADPHPAQATAIVLAGGASTRLGFDKRTLLVDGVPIVDHVCAALRPGFEQVLLGADAAGRWAHLGVEVVVDRVPGGGPMAAIAGCLARSRHELNFVTACDVPRPPLPVVRALLAAARGRDGAIAVTAEGRLEPLFAVYSRSLLPDMERLLAEGEPSLRPLFELRDFASVPLTGLGVDAIPNVNTPGDLARYGVSAGGRGESGTLRGAIAKAGAVRLSGEAAAVEEPCDVAVESALTIDVPGVAATTFMCTPSDERALAVGFLFTEGYIASMGDVADVARCPEDPCAIRVRLARGSRRPSGGSARSPVWSSGGPCGREEIEQRLGAAASVGDTLRIPRATLNAMGRALCERQEVFERCGGTHAVLLFDARGEVISFAEDIGRHNALDKAIGLCLLGGRSPSGCAAALSGRVSLEMVSKCAAAGLELVSAVSAPTSLAIDAARRRNLTLCAFVRGDRATVFTHPRRVG